MKQIIDWKNLDKNMIFEQLTRKIRQLKELDKQYILEDYPNDEVAEQFKYLEQDYECYEDKLALSMNISKMDIRVQQKYLQLLLMMDLRNDLSEKQKCKMMLSYGVLVNYFKKINERTDEELFMLSAISSNLDLEDYGFYIGILSDSNVAYEIVNKSNILTEQFNICSDIMDSQDNFPYNDISADNYNELVENALEVVKNYSFSTKQK